MLKSNLVKATLLIALMALSARAQTANALRQRYETVSVSESYKVRPNIIATVEYSPDGRAEEMRVEVSPAISDCANVDASLALTEEIIDELVPLSLRGKPGLEMQLATSANNQRSYSAYENLIIDRRLNGCGANPPIYRAVFIKWNSNKD